VHIVRGELRAFDDTHSAAQDATNCDESEEPKPAPDRAKAVVPAPIRLAPAILGSAAPHLPR
jgi:hypothetical protein